MNTNEMSRGQKGRRPQLEEDEPAVWRKFMV